MCGFLLTNKVPKSQYRGVFFAILFTALTSCAATKSQITSLNDLDYYLGNKALKEAPDNIEPEPTEKPEPDPTSENFNNVNVKQPEVVAPDYATLEASFDPALACLLTDDPRFSYRKKIAFTGLSVRNPQQIVDLQGIHQQYPKALITRFNQLNFMVIDATSRQLPDTYPAYLGGKAALIRHLARELNVQFVVSGSVVNTGFHATDRSSALSIIKSTFAGSSNIKERQLNIQLTIYDGTTGAIIDESLYQGNAKDNYKMGNEGIIFSARHLNTKYGLLADTFLEDQALWLESNLTCLPMQARITNVSGSGVTFATGTESLLLPGDQLTLLRRVQLPLGISNTPQYRYERNGTVVVSQVYPNGALALFENGTPPYQVNQGDIVQAW